MKRDRQGMKSHCPRLRFSRVLHLLSNSTAVIVKQQHSKNEIAIAKMLHKKEHHVKMLVDTSTTSPAPSG
jgi:hypothetical protein